MSRLRRFFSNDWTITLVSTMIGIMLGLYITNFFEHRNLVSAKKKALIQVRTELDDNASVLKEYHDTLSTKFEALSHIFQYLNEDMKLVVPMDSLDSVKKHTKAVFTFEGFGKLPGNQLELKGDLEVYLSSPLMFRDLSKTVWESYKQMEYLSVTKFECMTSIEGLYSMQEEVDEVNYAWKEMFYEGMDFIANPDLRKEYMKLLNKLITKQGLLLEFYKHLENVFEECK